MDKKTGEQQVPSVFDEKALEELYALLLREVKSKKLNPAAVKEIQEKTFEHRKKVIQDQTKKSNVDSIVSMYPFFKEQECTVSAFISLKLLLKPIDCCKNTFKFMLCSTEGLKNEKE